MKPTHQYEIFHLILKAGGFIVLDQPFLKDSYNIQSMKAVFIGKDLPPNSDDIKIKEWNSFINKSRKLIGVECYMEHIYDPSTCEIIGFMAFFNPDDNEVKTKHFRYWGKLRRTLERLPISKKVTDLDILQSEITGYLRYNVAPTKFLTIQTQISKIFKRYRHLK